MKKHSIFLWVLLLARLIYAQTGFYHGKFKDDFEKGSGGLPYGWILSGKGAWVDSGDPSHGKVIRIEGNGTDSGLWYYLPDILKPGHTYRFKVEARSLPGTGFGAALAGAVGIHRDFKPGTSWQRLELAFRVPETKGNHRIELGQWHVTGKIEFDNLEISEIYPIFGISGDFSLGGKETLINGNYEFDSGFNDYFSNISRPLKSFRAGFNTNRIVFSGGGGPRVEYQIEIPGGTIKGPGKLRFTLCYHVSGELQVHMAPLGSTNFKKVFSCSKVGGYWTDLPSWTTGAKGFKLRFKGVEDTRHSLLLQVSWIYVKVPVTTKGASWGKTWAPSWWGNGGIISDLQEPRPRTKTSALFHVPPGCRADIAMQSPSGIIWRKSISRGKTRVSYDILHTGTHIMKWDVSMGRKPTGGGELPFDVPWRLTPDFGHPIDGELWWAPSSEKVFQDTPYPSHRKKKALSIWLARDEWESFQVIARPKADWKNVGVLVEEARPPGAMPFAVPVLRFRTGRVGYVPVWKPTDSRGSKGQYPDRVIPLEGPVDVEKSRNTAFMISIYAPRDCPGGKYTFHLSIEGSMGKRTIPFEVHVAPVDIPRPGRMEAAFGFSTWLMGEYHKLGASRGLKKRLFEDYLRAFHDFRIAPYNPVPWNGYRAGLVKRGGILHYETYFDGFDSEITRVMAKYGFPTFMIRLFGNAGGYSSHYRPGVIGNYKEGDPEYERLFAEHAGAVEKKLKDLGLIDKAFLYWFDEPTPAVYLNIKKTNQRIRKAAPGLRRMLTEEPVKELYGDVDVWVPLTSRFDPSIGRRRLAKGDTIWWYLCTGPKAPYVTLFIDHPGTGLRAWCWLAWKYGITGVLVWNTNYWTSSAAFPASLQDPYEDPMSYVSSYNYPKGFVGFWGNGDGRFFYPPKDWKTSKGPNMKGPVPSQRLFVLRDGIEEYELFSILEGMVKEARKRGLNVPPVALSALNVPKNIIESPTRWNERAEPYDTHREILFKALMAMKKLL